VYWKQIGGQARRSTCLSHEDAIKKQEEFRVLDEDEDKEDGLDNQPASLSSTKRVGNYVAGPGRGIKTRVTTANCSLSLHKDKVFLQDMGAFINEKARQLSTRDKEGSSKNLSNDMISIQSEVLSKVLEAAKNNQAATWGDLLSKAGIFVFFLCAQNRCQNTLRSPVRREDSFFVVCVLLVPYFRLILFVAFFLCDLRPISTPLEWQSEACMPLSRGVCSRQGRD
jgi:hypothetical protein